MGQTTTKRLELKFQTANGKAKTLTIQHPKEGIDQETAKSAMDTLVAKDIFQDKQVDVFAASKSAQYVTRTVDEVYTAE